MIGWLWSLIVGSFCRHRWVLVNDGNRTEDGRVVGSFYEKECEKCGVMRTWKL